ncbi:MAG TPA: glycosyltransferase [Xanthobacteraceae bacterium]|nr:glycosyltransferase [Xanthobacteraceae bacterium]
MNPDVAASGVDPHTHYMTFGWQEGRNPSALFNTLYYRQIYMAEAAEEENPLLHCLRSGDDSLPTAPKSEEEFAELQRHLIADHFDGFFYRNRYRDLPAGMSPLDHYLTIGSREGRDPSHDFSVTEHLQANSHVSWLKVDPFYHYLMTSRHVARPGGVSPDHIAIRKVIEPEFDVRFYLDENPDVRLAGIDPVIHYLAHGAVEGRNPSPTFWTSYYRENNGDVRESNVNPFYHYLQHGRAGRRKPNPIGLDKWPAPAAPSDDEWNAAAAAKDVPNARITVIMPVYKGYAETLAAIHAVLANRQQTPFRLFVLNDCSPDAMLTERLRALYSRGLFHYAENERNRGFVGTVNRALDDRPSLDVVLLNADTVVFGNWLDRLVAHADRDSNVATVTPLSNNATICSYPSMNANNMLRLEISPAEIDRFTSIANRGGRSTIPTGVGFCLYVRRSVIDQLGKLDEEAFARGYGEENDLCMRALKAGFKNVLAHDVFVYHVGQVSFAGFAAAAESAQIALLEKHPDYRMRVESYCRANPAHDARMRLDLYRLAQRIGPHAVVFVTHPWMGGIKTHTSDLAARLVEENVRVLTIYAGDVGGDRVVTISPPRDLTIYTPNLDKINIVKHPELLRDFLGWLRPSLIHVHSFAGLTWQATLCMMSLIEGAGVTYFFTGHDFAPLCHRNHLVDNQGNYCRQPPVEVCETCVKADGEYQDAVAPQRRRDAYAAFLGNARRVFVPSADAAERLTRVFTAAPATIRPHEDNLPGTHWMPMPDRFEPPLRIVALGAFGAHKGAAVLHDLALDAKQRSLPIEFRIVGYSNMTDRLRALSVMETGPYDGDAEAMQRIRDYGPALAFVPSIWPETHCYTLSIALAMGVPPIVFDLGAQAERVRAAQLGRVLDPALIFDPSRLNDILLALPLRELWENRHPPVFASYSSIVENYYGLRCEVDNEYYPATG